MNIKSALFVIMWQIVFIRDDMAVMCIFTWDVNGAGRV